MSTWSGFGARLSRLAWLPLAVTTGLMLLVKPIDEEWIYDSPWVLLALNAVFLTGLPLAVAALAVPAYRRTGHAAVLAVGAGSLALAGSGLLPAVLSSTHGPAIAVATHNSAAVLAGACHLVAMLSGVLVIPQRRPQTRPRLIAITYGAVLGCLIVIYASALAGVMPPFLANGSFTPLRQAVLGAAVGLFGVSAAFWAVTWTQVRTPFARWYSLGLALYSVGLAAVLIQHAFGSPVGWTGRGAQYLAGAYLLIAVLIARSTHGLAIELTHPTLPYRPMVDSAIDPVITVDRNGGVLYWNDAARHRFGHEPPTVFGADLATLIAAGPGRAELGAALHTCLAGRVSRPIELTLTTADGARFPAEVTLYPIGGGSGRLAVCMVRDLTERQRTQGELLRTVALLTSQQELSPDGILAIDEFSQIISVNQRFLRMWCIPPEAATQGTNTPLRQAAQALVPDPAGFQARIDEIVSQRELRCHEELELVDGRTLDRVTMPINGRDGEYLGRVWFYRDISERKRAERAMREAAARLEERVRRRTADLERSNRDLEAFNYTTAHDLRTPLRALSGFSELLLSRCADQLDDRGRHYAERIREAAVTMDALVDSLLQLSSVARREVRPRSVNLSALASAVAAKLADDQPQRDASIAIQDGITAYADPVLLRTVLLNLMDNAWKFTADRSMTRIEFGTEPTGPGEVSCFIRDNGIGFDPAHAGRLFQPFQRLHDGRAYPGRGAGLATVRTIIERHGGRVWAEGRPEVGVTVHFALPEHEPAEPDTAAPVRTAR